MSRSSSGILLCTDIISRGIDIENVDWVIQYDPPKEASSFVHRCGRTARCERNGDALILLMPNEGISSLQFSSKTSKILFIFDYKEAFVDFMLINQRVPIQEFTELESMKSGWETTIKKVQAMAAKER